MQIFVTYNEIENEFLGQVCSNVQALKMEIILSPPPCVRQRRLTTSISDFAEQEAQLSPRDRAMRCVS